MGLLFSCKKNNVLSKHYALTTLLLRWEPNYGSAMFVVVIFSVCLSNQRRNTPVRRLAHFRTEEKDIAGRRFHSGVRRLSETKCSTVMTH